MQLWVVRTRAFPLLRDHALRRYHTFRDARRLPFSQLAACGGAVEASTGSEHASLCAHHQRRVLTYGTNAEKCLSRLIELKVL